MSPQQQIFDSWNKDNSWGAEYSDQMEWQELISKPKYFYSDEPSESMKEPCSEIINDLAKFFVDIGTDCDFAGSWAASLVIYDDIVSVEQLKEEWKLGTLVDLLGGMLSKSKPSASDIDNICAWMVIYFDFVLFIMSWHYIMIIR